MPLGNRGKEDYFKFWCMCAHLWGTVTPKVWAGGRVGGSTPWGWIISMSGSLVFASAQWIPYTGHTHPTKSLQQLNKARNMETSSGLLCVFFFKCHIGNYQHSLPHSNSSQQIKYSEPETCTAVLMKQNISIDDYSITDVKDSSENIK